MIIEVVFVSGKARKFQVKDEETWGLDDLNNLEITKSDGKEIHIHNEHWLSVEEL